MPVLNWIGKEKIVNHDKELPYRVLKPRKELSIGENSENLLIQGDNLEALKSLLPQYQGKVKCIYIDPPYNTGNEGWVYNDKVNSPQIKQWLNKVVGAEGEDLCRHDKWLCMMYPRLKLLRELLTEDGGIFISIDYNEEHSLRILMDEIFGEANYRNTFAVSRVKKNIKERDKVKALNFGYNSVVFYAKSPACLILPPTKPQAKDTRWHAFDAPGIRPTMEYALFGHKPPNGRHWMYQESKAQELTEKGLLRPNPRTGKPQYRLEASDETLLDTNWTDIQESSAKWGFLNGEKNVELIKRIVGLLVDSESGEIILDSFAGSGTTGHAVLEMNKADGGNRKFILVELEKHISESITSPRLKNIVSGFEGARFSDGTGQGFQFLDLNGELFDSSGMINRDAHYEDLAGYIYFSETGKHVSLESIKAPWIGESNGVNFFLLFSKPEKNVLDEAWLKKYATGDGKKVVYADKSLVDEEALAQYGVVFKQIPYELRQF